MEHVDHVVGGVEMWKLVEFMLRSLELLLKRTGVELNDWDVVGETLS